MKLIERCRERRAFNAQNCRRKQQREIDSRYTEKVTDIESRIQYVVENSIDEHAVIYCVKNHDREMYERISDHFSNLGFMTVITAIQDLDDEYLVISW